MKTEKKESDEITNHFYKNLENKIEKNLESHYED